VELTNKLTTLGGNTNYEIQTFNSLATLLAPRSTREITAIFSGRRKILTKRNDNIKSKVRTEPRKRTGNLYGNTFNAAVVPV